MKVTMLLADSAQAVDGKLYILGGGWSVIGPEPSIFGIAIKIEVPWDQSNVIHKLKLTLLDSDDQPIVGETPEGPKPIEVHADFEVGRPAGLKPGTPIDFPMAINFAPLPLEPGQRFVWRLEIDGKTEPDWRVAFNTRPAQPQSSALTG
jgi:Family of unknown function (DUF6941)